MLLIRFTGLLKIVKDMELLHLLVQDAVSSQSKFWVNGNKK